MYSHLFSRKLVWDDNEKRFVLQFGMPIPDYTIYHFRGFQLNHDNTEVYKYEVVLENDSGMKKVYEVYVTIFLSEDGKLYEKVEIFVLKNIVNNGDNTIYHRR